MHAYSYVGVCFDCARAPHLSVQYTNTHTRTHTDVCTWCACLRSRLRAVRVDFRVTVGRHDHTHTDRLRGGCVVLCCVCWAGGLIVIVCAVCAMGCVVCCRLHRSGFPSGFCFGWVSMCVGLHAVAAAAVDVRWSVSVFCV